MKPLEIIPRTAQCLKVAVLLLLSFVAYSAQAQTTTAVYKRNVTFKYGGYTFTDDLTFNYSDYIYYRGLSKSQPYTAYATEHTSHPYLVQLARVLDVDAKKLGYTGKTLVEYLTAFVQQSIPYKTETGEYPRYPIETIVDQGGDCEDKAALLAALLETFSFDAVMVLLPGHMATGVWTQKIGSYYTHDSRTYSYIEATSPSALGYIPPKFARAGASILNVIASAIYTRGADDEDDFVIPPDDPLPSPAPQPAPAPKPAPSPSSSQSSSSTIYINMQNAGTSTVTINGVTVTTQGNSTVTSTTSGGKTTITVTTR